jgi:hypothetical protein
MKIMAGTRIFMWLEVSRHFFDITTLLQSIIGHVYMIAHAGCESSNAHDARVSGERPPSILLMMSKSFLLPPGARTM